MVSLTFFGGINEIGGNKILVEDKNTKIFLDFGQSFGHLNDYFVDWLQPRDRFGLRDYFALGLMPQVKGLYSQKALQTTGMKYREPGFDAVFISHPHYDHTAHLEYLDPKIPIYMGETCQNILQSTQETTKTKFFDEEESDVRLFRTGKTIPLGALTITPIHVDHSVPGAYGFLVETGEGTICYTGDLRSHGAKPGLTQDFVEQAKRSEPELLIIEGTRVADKETRKNHTEQTVMEGSLKVARETEKLVLAMRYPKDMDRLRSFYQTAIESRKMLVVSLKTAHLLMALKGDEALNLPKAGDDANLKVYVREMSKEYRWQKELKERLGNACVDSQWVKAHQNECVWELDFTQMTELIDIEPEKGGACIHSMSEPFEEDPLSQLQDKVLQNWLERFRMPYHQLHASGHASMKEIFEMVETIRPKKVAPVHTQHPELFGMRGKIEVKKGQKIRM